MQPKNNLEHLLFFDFMVFNQNPYLRASRQKLLNIRNKGTFLIRF
jgi:hypothetical protein